MSQIPTPSIDGAATADSAAGPPDSSDPAKLRGGGSSSLKKHAYVGAVWTTGGQGLSNALRLISNLILTRILMPEAFGTMALVNVFVYLLSSFSDVGIGQSIIQNRRGGEPAYVNTAWTIQVARGAILALASVALAYPYAAFYGQPAVAGYVCVVGLTSLISGLNSTSLVLLRRRVRVGKLVTIELVSHIGGAAVAILWAITLQSVWALVLGIVYTKLLTMTLSHLVREGPRNRFRWDRASAGQLGRFGSWIFFNTMIGAVCTRMDTLILGKLMSAELLGVYAIGRLIPNVLTTLVNKFRQTVIVPVICRRNDLPRAELRRTIIRARRPLLVLAAVLIGLAAAFIDLLIGAVYDSRYHNAGWIASILMLGLWLPILLTTIGPALFAIGKLQYRLTGTIARLLIVTPVLYFSFQWYGLTGAVVVMAAGMLPGYVATTIGLYRERLGAMWQDVAATALLVAVFGGGLGLRWVFDLGFPFQP